MDSSTVKKSVTTSKNPGYTQAVVGKDMTVKSSSSTPARSNSSASSSDANPMSDSKFAKMAKKKGLPFTSPIRPTF